MTTKEELLNSLIAPVLPKMESVLAEPHNEVRPEAQRDHNEPAAETVVVVGGQNVQQHVDDEWAELVHPRKIVITQRMRELLKINHENVALAHILNETYGTEAEDKGDIRYDRDKMSWIVWNGKYWVEDPEGIRVVGLTERLLYDMMKDAAAVHDELMVKDIITAQSKANIMAAMSLLKPMVAVDTDMFDVDPTLINLENGTYNVTTGVLSPHKKADYITRIAGVAFDPNAKCPKWEAHIKLVIPDTATQEAFKVYVGHSLVAGNPENAAMFAYGSGKNGKSVTFATIDAVFKTYAIGASPSTFTERQNDDAPRPDLARMKGALMVTIPEGKQGRRLDEGVLKNLTGGSDDVTARFLYGREFSFKPTAKLYFHTNHLPKITGRDNGIWRRIYPIPFTTVVPPEARIPDYNKIMFETEGSGIFNWMVEGYKKYKISGSLIYTDVINEARDLYKDKEDILGDFFEIYQITGNPEHMINRSELYDEYKKWCNFDCANEKPFTKSKFNDMVEERVGSPTRIVKPGVSGWFWKGIQKPNYSITR